MTASPSPRANGDVEQGAIVNARVHDEVIVRTVASRGELDRFLRLPWRIYANDPVWVPPLLSDVRKVLDPSHPFHQHAEVECFLAWRGDQIVGRIAAIVNQTHIEFHQEKAGFFGLLECVDDAAVARALLETVESWLRTRGMVTIRGPMNLSTNDELVGPGVLMDGFDTPPVLMMGHTPPYYARLLESAGYSKAKDLLSYWMEAIVRERHVRFAEKVAERYDIKIRSLDMKRFDEEVALVQSIYNSAWERNWGFVPMTEAEIRYMAKALKPVVNPDFCILAYSEGRPIGFALMLPDFNLILRHMNGRLFPFGFLKLLWNRRKIDSVRILTLGLHPDYRHRGFDALLIHQLIMNGNKHGVRHGECSWILEDNTGMRHGLERVDAKVYKTYRVFEKPLNA